MKAVIVTRVSTKDQEEGHSIDAQHQRLIDYCARRGLSVLKSFTLIESSTRGDRKEFKAMMGFIKQQKETVALVCDAIDRLQRGFKESTFLDEMRRANQIELHFYREGIVLDKDASANDIMMWDFGVLGAKVYVTNLSANVRRSLEFKRKNGEWGGKAPLGYINLRVDGKSVLAHDPERAFLVRRLFEEYAKGCYSISGDLTRMARAWGLKNKSHKGGYLSASQIHNILMNPFYMGLMKYKDTVLPHKYAPLITPDLFDRCEAIRHGKSRPFVSKYSEKPFVFRGLVRCAVSGRMVTCDVKKKKNVYLICRNPDDPEKKIFVREDVVLEQITNVLRSIAVPDALLTSLKSHMRASHEAERRFHTESIMALRQKHDAAKGQLDRLLNLYLTGSITQSEYDKKATMLKEERHEMSLRISQHEKGDEAFRTTLETLLSLASRAAELFERSKTEQKRQLVNFVFSNLKLRGEKLDFSLRSPFHLMVNRPDHTSWLGDVDSNHGKQSQNLLSYR